ncbi:hypothetical protein [Halovivax sp.]|uniref:hypothetical protein n=1 Tax=Halovivax sp. TaxID=1935978 RepID=UPI0025C33603|nr:hypothetical protein [Halovivax sp.]
MDSKKFTLFELHIDGETQVGPAALPDAILGGRLATAGAAETATSEQDQEADDEEAGGRGAIAVVVGLIAVVAIGLAVRKFRGGEEEAAEPLEPADERDVVVS